MAKSGTAGMRRREEEEEREDKSEEGEVKGDGE